MPKDFLQRLPEGPGRVAPAFWIVSGCLLFAGSIDQPPLFYANQNTYFLTGLAQAGYGFLASDWLAGQTDIVPVFSAIVFLLYRLGEPWLFPILVLLLNGALAAVYAAALFVLSGIPIRRCPVATVAVVAFFLLLTLISAPELLESAIAVFGDRGASVTEAFNKVTHALTSGVAHQDGLSGVLQPSSFGVLMIASISLFVRRKDYMAVVCAALAATIHTSLILHACVLTAAYVVVCASERRYRRATGVAALALVLTAPITMYIAYHFVFLDSPDVHRLGHWISADVRQPHHTQIGTWSPARTFLQLAVMSAGILLARGQRRLFMVLILSAGIACVLTLTQVSMESRGLALLFPWRASTWLVPIGTFLVAARVSLLVAAFVGRTWMAGFAGILVYAGAALLAITALGGIRSNLQTRVSTPPAETVEASARQHGAPGQVYLVPLNLERFRLQTGIPIFVDWKSFPYRSGEIAEWYERVTLAAAFHTAATAHHAIVALGRIQEVERITHVVMRLDAWSDAGSVTYGAPPPGAGPMAIDGPVLCSDLGGRLLFADRRYLICELPPGDRRRPPASKADGR